MKNLIFCLSAIFFSTASYAQEVRVQDVTIQNLGDGQLYVTNRDAEKTPVEGQVQLINGYTSEYIDAKFEKGYPEGVWKYYKNKVLLEEKNYAKGYLNGDRITYYSDGTIKEKTPFLNGEVNGTITSFNHNGKKTREKGMKNGRDEGWERSYSENGKITSEINYVNGKAEGRSFKTMNASNDDEYRVTTFYKDGQQDGDFLEKFANGTTKTKGRYVLGKKDGTWESFKKDGTRKGELETYSKGELIKKISYFSNGKIEKEQEMKNGKRHGVEKAYTLDGSLKSEKNYAEGKQFGKQMRHITNSFEASNSIEYSNYNSAEKLDGEFSEVYSASKKPKTKGQYKNGHKDGKWNYYSHEGILEREEIYENGSLKSSEKKTR